MRQDDLVLLSTNHWITQVFGANFFSFSACLVAQLAVEGTLRN